ncbi:MAG: sigma-54 dependent transcriptional regulator, partial [Thermodesulfovibrionales bacterium]|nr:sigma-54 dependent transcriptional regulator [Thermodesulfovibrionales bacterium]
PDICSALEFILKRKDYEVKSVYSGEDALKLITKEDFDVVITDLKMGKVDGMEVLKKTKEISPNTNVIIITAFGSIESAVEAMKNGASDYIIKPFYNEEIIITVKKNIEQRKILRENIAFKQQISQQCTSFGDFIANSPVMQKVIDTIKKVSPTKSNILILGESGTGKGLIAELIHYNSPRCDNPFISINCSAIPEGLLESELFGYKKGAFTGAVSDKLGLLPLAHQGTFFFDEIGEMPINLQVKLLKVIESGEVYPLGDIKPHIIDVRIISATNIDLEKKVKEGKFREDLYWRLNVIEIKVPPLRERKDDIELLTRLFIKKIAAQHGKKIENIEPDALSLLINYSWPGNVRELKNVIERAVILCNDNTISIADLPDKLKGSDFRRENCPLKVYLDDYEKRILLSTYLAHNKSKEETAKALGIDIVTLYRKLKKYKIDS